MFFREVFQLQTRTRGENVCLWSVQAHCQRFWEYHYCQNLHKVVVSRANYGRTRWLNNTEKCGEINQGNHTVGKSKDALSKHFYSRYRRQKQTRLLAACCLSFNQWIILVFYPSLLSGHLSNFIGLVVSPHLRLSFHKVRQCCQRSLYSWTWTTREKVLDFRKDCSDSLSAGRTLSYWKISTFDWWLLVYNLFFTLYFHLGCRLPKKVQSIRTVESIFAHFTSQQCSA